MLTAEQKIKREIILAATKSEDFSNLMDGASIDSAYSNLVENDGHWDAKYEIRGGHVETEIPSEWSRHYVSKSVAMKCCDGTWVGWTYWYGGGKHGEPENVEWMEHAYDLDCTEEQKMVTVQTFTKNDPSESKK